MIKGDVVYIPEEGIGIYTADIWWFNRICPEVRLSDGREYVYEKNQIKKLPLQWFWRLFV